MTNIAYGRYGVIISNFSSRISKTMPKENEVRSKNYT